MSAHSAKILGSVPVLILKVGQYPLSHGVLGAIRSLGRAGVSVYAVCEDHFVPYAVSRFLSGGFLLPAIDYKNMGSDLVPHLVSMARLLQRKCILFPTDDEAAIFAAEHATVLQEHYHIPLIDAALPRILASKHGLSQLCMRHGVPVPATQFARSMRDLLSLSQDIRYPIVVKNSEPWIRLSRPAVRATTIVESRDKLIELASLWQDDPQVVLQEYIPQEDAEDWIFHGYFDGSSRPVVAFTGFKQRSWPPYAGVTAAAIAVPNEPLAAAAVSFCREIGYRGIVDMDWRYDGRDRRFKLVDFNPRLGANFRAFVTDSGLDVVRAQYLDLTGQPIPVLSQTYGRRFVVENLNLASSLYPASYRSVGGPPAKTSLELAWFAVDDPLPFVSMALRFCGQVFLRIVELLVHMLKRTRIGTARHRDAGILEVAREALAGQSATDAHGRKFGTTNKTHQGPKGWGRG
jgi:D-aspartate ligase